MTCRMRFVTDYSGTPRYFPLIEYRTFLLHDSRFSTGNIMTLHTKTYVCVCENIGVEHLLRIITSTKTYMVIYMYLYGKLSGPHTIGIFVTIMRPYISNAIFRR